MGPYVDAPDHERKPPKEAFPITAHEEPKATAVTTPVALLDLVLGTASEEVP
jgi:hypothetical protein